MEKTISQEERIRRAEEIYYRRKTAGNSGIRVSSNSVNTNSKPKISLFKKMLLQLAICAVIYIIFYLIKNTNYIFSDDVINKTKEFLSYDINFGNVYAQVSSFIENNKDKLPFFGTTETMQQTTQQNTQPEANMINEVAGGIGGAETNEIETNNTDTTKKSQMELDAEYIKKNYNLILPLKGTVTSRYGAREATEVVSANHQGIDIGANTGTIITAAMDGTVTLASEEGEYGKHIDITNGEILTRYAHCSELLVKEGQKVKKGQKIAKVGQTGRATGPHLHFEIRRDNRVVNPEYVLKF